MNSLTHIDFRINTFPAEGHFFLCKFSCNSGLLADSFPFNARGYSKPILRMREIRAFDSEKARGSCCVYVVKRP